MAYKVLIPQDIAEEGKEYLISHGYEIKMGSGITEMDLARDVEDCDAMLLRTAEVTGAVLRAGKKLRIVARHGAGYNNVDIKTATELGIWVTNTPDATTGSVAEFTVGAMIAAGKRFVELRDALKQGDFGYKNKHMGTDLAGKRLGIIGIGKIGLEVAKKAFYGLDMEILAYSPRKRQGQMPDYVRLVPWEMLFELSDFIAVHVPLTEETRGFIGAKELERMKPSAVLINCSRGGVVVEEELVRALREGQLAGLFTDVMEQEPPDPNHPFFQMNHVTVTPHMASNTRECMIRMAVQAAAQIDLVFSGKEPEWAVNCIKYQNT